MQSRITLRTDSKSEYMTDVVWRPLPSLWPSPAVSTDVGGFMLLVFTEASVPTWEVRRHAKKGGGDSDLVVAAPPTPSKRPRQRRCLKRRPGPQNDESVKTTRRANRPSVRNAGSKFDRP